MASSSSWKLRALMKKNLLIMKRNACSTIFEILFPIALILLCYVIRLAFQLKKYYFKDEETDIPTYIKNTSSIYQQDYSSPSPLGTIGTDTNLGFSIIPALKICTAMNDKFEARPIIASIGLPLTLKNKIMREAGDYSSLIRFEEFSSIEQMEDRIKDKTYGKNNDLICFGIRYKKDGHKYDYSLHYFDSMFSQGVQDIPNMRNGVFDKFSTGPDLEAYRKYQDSGYIYIMKLINEYILAQETDTLGKTNEAKIDMAMIALPYENYRSDPFSAVIGYFIPFFMVIAYMCPLCLYVYRMVGEKENKSKEGMKIMGLSEGTYFLSYFIQYVIITFIDSVINTFFMSMLFSRIPFILLFVILFLWALDIFGLIFFFQSFIDKTRVALILSLLIYFVMFFLSMACMDEEANKVLKIILSIFPPVSLELGIVLIGKFQSHFKDFHYSDYAETYTNYSIFIMNLMQIIDFFLYLFLGYYLQNIIPHEFGIKRPFYFICTKEYWC
jgi:ATP-binding cassette subfamily A (ABC1) protein 3